MKMKDFINELTGMKLDYEAQTERVDAWKSWYDGFVKKFHQYRVYNGSSYVYKDMHTLHMAKKVCEDWADLLFNERCMISTDKDEATEKLQAAMKAVRFRVRVNHGIELGMALGTVGWVFNLDENKKSLTFETVTADMVYPITVENGEIVECAFIAFKKVDMKDVAYVSLHTRDEQGLYVIENGIYAVQNKQIGALIDSWSWETAMATPWFAIFEPNAVNNFDLDSPYGISVFANCEPVLQEIDTEFDAIGREVDLGKMRIIASVDALSYYSEDGQKRPVFDPNETVIMAIPKGMNDQPMLQTIAPPLRTESQIRALNNSLSHLSSKVGMGPNHYSFDGKSGTVKTATEVISNDAPLYRRLKKHEMNLEVAIDTLIHALAEIHTRFMGDPIIFEELNIQFDDSIVQDKDAERKQDEKDVYLGVLSKVEYRMKWYGEDEETARARVEEAKNSDIGEGDF